MKLWDFYASIGCCLTCEDQEYGCMCRSCRCRACVWYCSGNCSKCAFAQLPCWFNEEEAEHYIGWQLTFKSCQIANYVKMGVYGNVDVEEVHQTLIKQLEQEGLKMVKVSELSNFVVAGVDVHTGDIVTFTTPGVIRSAEETPFGREVFQIGVKLPDGSEKTLTMNKTSIRNIAREYGDETKEWVGKQAVVTLVKQMVRDTMKDVIYLNPLQKTLRKKTEE